MKEMNNETYNYRPDMPIHHYRYLPERTMACGYDGLLGTRIGEHWYSWYVDTTTCLKCLEIGWPHSTRLKEVQAAFKVDTAIKLAQNAKWNTRQSKNDW